MFDETNVGLAQDTSRQFDWVNIIYSGFAPSTTGKGCASVSHIEKLGYCLSVQVRWGRFVKLPLQS